jgi:hypothetical protein
MQNKESKSLIVNEDLTPQITSTVELESETVETVISENEIAGWSKKQLVDKLAEYLETEDIYTVYALAKLVKNKYDEIAKEEYDQKLKEFMQDGSLAEDYEPKANPLDEMVDATWKSINAKKVGQQKQKEKQVQENLSTKKLIIEELKELLKGNHNFTASYQKFQALQSKWRATGKVPMLDHTTLNENYHFLIGKFYDMIKINNELNDLDKKKSVEHKTQLCEKAELLNAEPSIKKALEGFRALQEEWNDIRNTPKELKDVLWNRFKEAGDKLVERQKEYITKQKALQENNLEAKTTLCQQMEQLCEIELTSHKACKEASKKADELWEAWQKISFVPKSDNGNCWKRFKKARTQFQQQADAFYAKQRGEFAANLEKKTALCIKAEALMISSDWNVTAEALKKLQTEWKTIGSVAVKDSDKIWNRFRKACDTFFERKKNQVIELENALIANIQLKEAIIATAETIQPSADIALSMEELKKIQEEFAQSGEVPSKDNDRLNNAFGKAMEQLLECIKTSANMDDKLFYRLKYEQMLKSPQGAEQIKSERFAMQGKIKKLQTEADQLENNLGFFGKSKNTNPLLADYTEKLDKIKAEIKELTAKLKLIPVV